MNKDIQSADQYEALRQITQAVMGLMDMWQLDTQEIQELLLLPSNVRARALQKMRDGKDVLPASQDTLRRANYLLRIAE